MDSKQCTTERSDSQQELETPSDSMDVKLTNNHLEHVKKLKDLIAVWKNGFLNGLNILSSKTNPKTEIEEICKELNIPVNLIYK